MKIKSFGRWLAGGVALVTGSQQFWVRASIFFQRCPLAGDLREICLVSGRCFFGGASNLPEPGSLTGAGKGAILS
jgi:hypothetical protein